MNQLIIIGNHSNHQRLRKSKPIARREITMSMQKDSSTTTLQTDGYRVKENRLKTGRLA